MLREEVKNCKLGRDFVWLWSVHSNSIRNCESVVTRCVLVILNASKCVSVPDGGKELQRSVRGLSKRKEANSFKFSPPKYWEFVALRYILARAQPRTPLGNLQHWLSLSWLPRSLKQKMGLLTRLNKPTYTIFAWYSFVCAYGQLNSRELWGGWLCATIGRGNAASWRWGCRVDAPDLIETSSNWQTRYTCTETYWNIMTR